MRCLTSLTVMLLALTISINAGCIKCGEKTSRKIAEKMVEQATGGKIDVGTVDVSDLPANLRYPGATARAKWAATGKDGTGTVWVFEINDPKPQVVDYYKKALASWKTSFTSETPEATTLMFVSPDEKEFIALTIGSENGKTTLNITHTKK